MVSSCFWHTMTYFKKEFIEFRIEEDNVANMVDDFVKGKGRLVINKSGDIGGMEDCTDGSTNALAHILNGPDTTAFS